MTCIRRRLLESKNFKPQCKPPESTLKTGAAKQGTVKRIFDRWCAGRRWWNTYFRSNWVQAKVESGGIQTWEIKTSYRIPGRGSSHYIGISKEERVVIMLEGKCEVKIQAGGVRRLKTKMGFCNEWVCAAGSKAAR